MPRKEWFPRPVKNGNYNYPQGEEQLSLTRPECCAFLSALYAALACSADNAGGSAVLAVQIAVTAAAGRDLDLESPVMAALL